MSPAVMPGRAPAQEAGLSLEVGQTATAESHTITATGFRPTGAPWVMERSLSMRTGGPGLWFPFYQEHGSFADPGGGGVVNGVPLSPLQVLLRELPPLPPPPPATSSAGMPRPRYLYGHTTLRLAADGTVHASWPSLDSAGTLAQTVFPASPSPELELRNPVAVDPNRNRPVFGVGIQNQSTAGTLPPLIISYAVTALPSGESPPSGLPALGEKDGFIRAGLLAFGAAIREDCWPVMGPPSPPPPPPTLNDRSFYRIKTLDLLHDTNNNGFPDELEGTGTDLKISEVCYVSLTPVAAHAPHTFTPSGEDSLEQPAFLNRPPDWVEILNPTAADISLGGYFLTDKSSDPARFPLPPSVTIPAYSTLILLLTDDPHPLFAAEGDPGSMVRKCWVPFRLKDEGEAVHLSKDDDADPVTAPVIFDTLHPPWTGSQPLTGYTAGIVPRANGIWETVFLPAPSPEQINQGWALTRKLSAPEIREQPVSGPSVPAHSRLFRQAGSMPRLVITHPDPAAVITYTLDGTEPGPDDGIYDGPLEIHTTTVLRARAFAADAIPSPVSTRTYISSPGVLTQLYPPPLPVLTDRAIN